VLLLLREEQFFSSKNHLCHVTVLVVMVLAVAVCGMIAVEIYLHVDVVFLCLQAER
jgi:hypothetical protein